MKERQNTSTEQKKKKDRIRLSFDPHAMPSSFPRDVIFLLSSSRVHPFFFFERLSCASSFCNKRIITIS